MKRTCSTRNMPISCLIPGSDAKALSALTGDPEISAIVAESKANDVGKLCAVLLRSLPVAERRDALRLASAESSGSMLQGVPIAALLPDDATVDQLSAMWNGLMLLLLSLGSSSADTSVGTVVANAMSMASGIPFASDPLKGERQNEVILAKAILEASLLDDETAKQWFVDNDLLAALERIARSADQGSSDAIADPVTAEAVRKAVYDCIKHDAPLGGEPMSGNGLADFASDIWTGIKTAAGNAIRGWGDSILDSENEDSAGDKLASTVKQVAKDLGADVESSEAESSSAIGAVRAGVERGVAQAREALAAAKDKLESGQANIAAYQTQLKSTALENAKLQWAQAFLDAPDDVASILAAATPNLADPASFIQSMLATLPAAKSTGNLGTLKALLYALKAAASKGDGSADALYSLIAGDIARACESMESGTASCGIDDVVLADQKRHLATLASVAQTQAEKLSRKANNKAANKKGG